MKKFESLLPKALLMAVLCCGVLAQSGDVLDAAPQIDSKPNRLLRTAKEIAAPKAEVEGIKERASRILSTTYPVISVRNYRRAQTLVFKNKFNFDSSTNLTQHFSSLKTDADSSADSPSNALAPPKAVSWGSNYDYIVIEMDEKTQIDNQYLFLSVGNTSTPVVWRSDEKIYQYYDSSANGNLVISLVLAILFIFIACCCWVFGNRQSFLLVRIPQMLFMLNLMGSKPHAANVFSFLENFRYNLLNFVPSPVAIEELMGNECQPPIQFFAEMMSCHAYNTLKNYVVGFLIFTIFYAYLITNKAHDREFFQKLQKTMNYHIYMLAIFPDVAIAIYLNAVAPLGNSVVSSGFFFSLILIIWYVHIFSSVIGSYYYHNSQKVVDFLTHFVFSRSNLTVSDPKIGLKLLAVLFEYLKIFIKVTMIVLFFNAPKTQMVIIFLVYLFNAVFLLVFRPYTNIFQNVFFATSDLAFFIIVVLAYSSNDTFDSTTMSTKENRYGSAQSAMVFIIFFVNIFNFFIPILKGQDAQVVIHKTNESVIEDGSNQELNGKTSTTILKKEPEADKPNQVDQKELERAGSRDFLGKPKPVDRDIHTAEGRSNSRFTEGSELPLNREEQIPMKPKETENPALAHGKKKVEIKGLPPTSHKEMKPSEENLLRGDVNKSQEHLPSLNNQGKDHETTAQNSHQPKKNNLITTPVEPSPNPSTNQANQPGSQIQSLARLDQAPPADHNSSQLARSSELPPVRPAGKVPVRRTFKPNDVKNQDFEGM